MIHFGYWIVQYKDGTTTHQFDREHPKFQPAEDHIAGGEIPYHAIDWPAVDRILFADADNRITPFTVGEIPEGYQISLRSRHFKTTSAAALAMCFMLVLSRAGEPVTEESTVSVLYWFPDHSTHTCPHFNCPDIYQYGLQLVHSLPDKKLSQHTELATVAVDAVLV